MAMKRLPALSAPTVCFTRSKKYCLKMLGSSVLPDLLETMNKRLRQIDFVLERLDLRRIGGIEHVQSGKPAILPKVISQHFGAQTGTTHAQQQDVGEVFFLDICDRGAQLVAVSDLVVGDVEPAQPVGFVGAGPERGIVLPQTADLVAGAPVVDVGLYRGRQGLGQFVGLQT